MQCTHAGCNHKQMHVPVTHLFAQTSSASGPPCHVLCCAMPCFTPFTPGLAHTSQSAADAPLPVTRYGLDILDSIQRHCCPTPFGIAFLHTIPTALSISGPPPTAYSTYHYTPCPPRPLLCSPPSQGPPSLSTMQTSQTSTSIPLPLSRRVHASSAPIPSPSLHAPSCIPLPRSTSQTGPLS